jgi:translocation and assembly module TamB
VDAGGGNRGALSALRLVASKLERDRYRLELDATGAKVAALGQPLPGEVQAEVRIEARPEAGVLSLASALRGERGARVGLDLDASFERASERLKYALALSAEKLEAFAGVAQKVDARAARIELGGARLMASARGDLAGVLRAPPGELPAPVENPLGKARGEQTAKLELAGLDYRGPDGTLRVPELAFEIESTHRAEQGGNANARLALSALDFAGGGRSIELRGLDQKLVATFERAPDQGLVDVHGSLALDSAEQSWLPGYPVKKLALSTNVQIDRLRSIYLRELVLDNPASGSSLQAAGTLELLAQGTPASGKTIVGREALSFEGRLQQEMATLEQLELASHASGTVLVPFRLESGGLIGYRLLATIEAKQVSFVRKDGTLAIDGLNGSIPIVEEFALLPSGPVISAGPRTSPLSDTRFFDVHPFLSQNDYVTARSLNLGGLAPLGPIAANVRVERSDFVIDQLQTGYRGGQIVGQVRVGWRDGDPIVRLRLNATGVRSGKSQDVFDANTALTFVPAAMTLDGKMQIVRASREHLEDILDVLDPFHEAANANRVRRALALGYPKFVRFQLHDGAVDTKVELGGIAGLVRIDEIRAVPLGPILQKYVAPALSGYLRPTAAPSPSSGVDATLESARRDEGERSPRVIR